MQIEQKKLFRAARLVSGQNLTVIGVIAAASLLVSSGCHRTMAAEEQPVAVGMPMHVSQKVDNAQAAFVDSMSTLASNYDQAVCEEGQQMAESSHSRQALAEAHLEIADALSDARARVSQNRGGGPTAEDEGITIIEEPPKAKTDRGGWTCMEAAGEPACVNAAANNVASKVYNNYVSGYDLNLVTAGDVLEAFAADARWADQYLSKASDRSQAFRQIEQACREGNSPLSRFFAAAAEFDHPQVRRDLLALRDDFASGQQDVCAALPSYYSSVMGELKNNLDLRMRTGRCAASHWQVLWDE